jgi:hypothetical protein
LAEAGPHAKLFATGHSLGGALATLAAYDLGRFVAENRAFGRIETGRRRRAPPRPAARDAAVARSDQLEVALRAIHAAHLGGAGAPEAPSDAMEEASDGRRDMRQWEEGRSAVRRQSQSALKRFLKVEGEVRNDLKAGKGLKSKASEGKSVS